MSFRHSKIVCTIGPASRSPRMIDRLMNAGMDVARLNFSHGTHEEHAKSISLLRAAAVEHEKPIAILADLIFALKHGADYIAVSFVRHPDDVLLAKQLIRRAGKDVPVIAKLEKPEAIENLDAILRAADGVMVARGDLGVEMNPERVPVVQKMIIARARAFRRPVITATQMLESMTENPRPTRAEAST